MRADALRNFDVPERLPRMSFTFRRTATLALIVLGTELGCVGQVLFDRTTGDTFTGDTRPDEIDSIALIEPMVMVMNADGSRDTSETDTTRKILLSAVREAIPEQITLGAFPATPAVQHDLNEAMYHLLDGLVDGKTAQRTEILAELSAILQRERVRFGLGILHFGRSVPRGQDRWSNMRCVIVDSQNRDVVVFGWSLVHGHAPSEEQVVRYQLSRTFKKYFKPLKSKR